MYINIIIYINIYHIILYIMHYSFTIIRYEKQGYDIINEIRPNEEELLRVCLDELANDICCVLMRKTII